MSDEDDDQGLPETMMLAAASAAMQLADPTGGIVTAVGSVIATRLSTEAGIQAAVNGLWQEAIVDEIETRERQYRETRSEFEKHRLIVDWIIDDLGAARAETRDANEATRATRSEMDELRADVRELQVAALGLLDQSGALLRQKTEPAIRPYLVAAWRNAVRRPDYFTGAWMARCLAALQPLQADHLRLLRAFIPYAHESVVPFHVHLVFERQDVCERIVSADANTLQAWQDLVKSDGLLGVYPNGPLAILSVTPTAWRTIELISPERLTLKPKRVV